MSETMDTNEVFLNTDEWKPRARIDVENVPLRDDLTRQYFRVELENLETKKSYLMEGAPFRRYATYIGTTSKYLKNLAKVHKVGERGREYSEYGSVKPVNDYLETAWENVKFNRFLALTDGGHNILRLTSEDFISLPNNLVYAAVENRMRDEGIEILKKEVNYNHTEYRFDGQIEGSDIDPAMYIFNRNDGMSSIKMFTGGIVGVCSNGMIFGDSIQTQKLKHVRKQKMVARLIDQTITRLLSTFNEGMSQVEALKNMRVTKKEAEHIVLDLLPVYPFVREEVWNRLNSKSKQTQNGKTDWDGTMHGIFMASTYVSAHSKDIRNKHGRVGLSDIEYRTLSDVQTFHADWDAREKELERLEAQRIQARSK